MDWRIVASSTPIQATIQEGDYFPVGTIEPVQAYLVEDEISANGSGRTVPAGVYLSPSAADPRVMCEPLKRRRKGKIICVADRDSDGRIDNISFVRTGRYSYASVTKLNPMIGRVAVEKWKPFDSSASIAGMKPATDFPALPIDLIVHTDLNGARITAKLCYVYKKGQRLLGFDKSEPFCMGRSQDHSGAYPYTISKGALRIEFLSLNREEDTIDVDITGWKAGSPFSIF